MATIQLTIVTPEGKPFDGEVERVIVRTTGGDVCVMARHIDFAAAIGKGIGRAVLADGNVRRMSLDGGMLHMSDNRAHILTNHFSWVD